LLKAKVKSGLEHGIMKMAGEPGDRWLKLRSGGVKPAYSRQAAATRRKREESPDTVLRHGRRASASQNL
jgi:hypothetical protein